MSTLTPSAPPSESRQDVRIIQFSAGDPDEAVNWSTGKRGFVVVVGILLVINSTLGSSLSSGAVPVLQKEFKVTSPEQLALPNSMYLLGYVFGPPLFSPMSEMAGRRIVLQLSFFGFTIFSVASALAPSWPSLIGFRFLAGTFASAPISVVGGLYADLFYDPVKRGRAIAVLVGSTTVAPVLGPIVSAFVSTVSWRWSFWIACIAAGVCWPALIFLPESFGPAILKRRAKRMRLEDPSVEVIAPIELQHRTVRDVIVVTLTRPIRLLAEPIVLICCTYLAFEYAIFYIFFVAYPIIFEGTYEMSIGVATLPLLPIGVGAVLACFISVFYDDVLRRAQDREAAWAQLEEYRRLPLACLGGPLHVLALFWLGWTARSNIHYMVPTVAGLPFGIGIELTFISLLNYMADAYGIYAASAMATSTFTRSIFAVLLPLCTDKLYGQLGVAWATSLLGFIGLAMACGPFLLLRYGALVRKRSRFCQELQAEGRMPERSITARQAIAAGETGSPSQQTMRDG